MRVLSLAVLASLALEAEAQNNNGTNGTNTTAAATTAAATTAAATTAAATTAAATTAAATTEAPKPDDHDHNHQEPNVPKLEGGMSQGTFTYASYTDDCTVPREFNEAETSMFSESGFTSFPMTIELGECVIFNEDGKKLGMSILECNEDHYLDAKFTVDADGNCGKLVSVDKKGLSSMEDCEAMIAGNGGEGGESQEEEKGGEESQEGGEAELAEQRLLKSKKSVKLGRRLAAHTSAEGTIITCDAREAENQAATVKLGVDVGVPVAAIDDETLMDALRDGATEGVTAAMCENANPCNDIESCMAGTCGSIRIHAKHTLGGAFEEMRQRRRLGAHMRSGTCDSTFTVIMPRAEAAAVQAKIDDAVSSGALSAESIQESALKSMAADPALEGVNVTVVAAEPVVSEEAMDFSPTVMGIDAKWVADNVVADDTEGDTTSSAASVVASGAFALLAVLAF